MIELSNLIGEGSTWMQVASQEDGLQKGIQVFKVFMCSVRYSKLS